MIRHDGNDYYAIHCQTCGDELALGQKKTGDTLFIKRKDKDGNILPNGGWKKWQTDTSH